MTKSKKLATIVILCLFLTAISTTPILANVESSATYGTEILNPVFVE